MFLQNALRASLALLLVCGLASFPRAIVPTARSETAQAKQYVSVPVTGSIETVLDLLEERTGTDFPLAELLSDDPAGAVASGITSGVRLARRRSMASAATISIPPHVGCEKKTLCGSKFPLPAR
jgi:hypothetical protein